MEQDFLTVKELADILQVSRIAVFNRIKKGQIPATKMGRNFIIFKKDIPMLADGELTAKIKRGIERGVTKVISEYGETLRLLGKE